MLEVGLKAVAVFHHLVLVRIFGESHWKRVMRTAKLFE